MDNSELEIAKEALMPRQARLDAPGTLHHVLLRGIEKRRIVDDDKDRQSFVRRLGGLSVFVIVGSLPRGIRPQFQ